MSDDTLSPYLQELRDRTIAQQTAKMETYLELRKRGLPIPPDLAYEMESLDQGCKIQSVHVLDLKPGEILHVKVGISALDMGKINTPWIPTPEDLTLTKETFEAVVPDGVKVVATHFGVDLTAVAETSE